MVKRNAKKARKATKGRHKASKASRARPHTRSWSIADVPFPCPPRETWRLEWRDRATTLLRAYNDALLSNPGRRKHAEKGLRRSVRSGTEGNLEALYAVDVWVRRRGADPVIWVRWAGRRVKNADDSAARLASLFNEELFQAFLADDMANLDVARERDAELHARLGGGGFVVGRDMHHGAELAKWHFRARGHEILCIESHDLTFGFHPASTVCADCPLKERCAAETKARLGVRAP